MVDTRLADRTASQAPFQGDSHASSDQASSEAKGTQHAIPSPSVTIKRHPSSETSASLTELLNTTRADLSEAQRSRSELQDRLNRVIAEVEKLRKKSNQDGRRINALESEGVNLQLRLKDREEELRGKAKLLEVGNLWMNWWLICIRTIYYLPFYLGDNH